MLQLRCRGEEGKKMESAKAFFCHSFPSLIPRPLVMSRRRRCRPPPLPGRGRHHARPSGMCRPPGSCSPPVAANPRPSRCHRRCQPARAPPLPLPDTIPLQAAQRRSQAACVGGRAIMSTDCGQCRPASTARGAHAMPCPPPRAHMHACVMTHQRPSFRIWRTWASYSTAVTSPRTLSPPGASATSAMR